MGITWDNCCASAQNTQYGKIDLTMLPGVVFLRTFGADSFAGIVQLFNRDTENHILNMTSFSDFEKSLGAEEPPTGLPPAMEALWWLRNGDWDKAHTLVQALTSSDGAWVHAHLHRVEGDLGNAAHWYHRAGKDVTEISLKDEWQEMALALAK